MTKKYTPKKIINYLVVEFSISLFIFFSIFLSLIYLSTFIEELIFFREKQLEGNLYFKVLLLSLIKLPTIVITMSPFVFLFSGIFFFVKLLRNNEVAPISLSGLSNNFIVLVPSVYSFIIGIMLIFILTPISSQFSRYYENFKQKYSDNKNLIIISETGIWLKEQRDLHSYIIRTDDNKNKKYKILKNISIYKFNMNNEFIERIEGSEVNINKNIWLIKNVKKLDLNGESQNLSTYIFETKINLDELIKFYENSNTFSVWDIPKEIKKIRERGYIGQELFIKLNKFLSLPFFLFSMIFLSKFFTLDITYRFNNFIYAFIGIICGIAVYYLTDLSIAMGKSGKIPLILAVWMPIILFFTFSIYSLIRTGD